jgi:hypothetical protein
MLRGVVGGLPLRQQSTDSMSKGSVRKLLDQDRHTYMNDTWLDSDTLLMAVQFAVFMLFEAHKNQEDDNLEFYSVLG